MYLIVTTPRFILGFDADTGKVDVLSSGSRYYGLTWSLSGDELAITHANYDGELNNLGDSAMADTGYMTVGERQSWAFLNVPHQALWVDDNRILALNTGRNAIACLDTTTMSVVQTRYDPAIWDVHDKSGAAGAHYNSVFHDGSYVYFVAHNFTRGAFIVRAHWPSLELVDRHPIQGASGVHNLWIDEHGRWIVCDSNAGGVVDARSGEHLWDCRGEGYTRGLAASGDLVFVGNSELTSRSRREFTETGIWVLDRRTFRMRDFLLLGSFGGVHEIRIADEPDACHHGRPLADSALSVLAGWRENRRRAVLAVGSARLPDADTWRARIGRFDVRDGVMVSAKDALAVMTRRGTEASVDFVVSAQLHVLEWSESEHASLILRYRGIEDDRMYAVLFRAQASDNVSASIWLQDGEWRCLASERLAPHLLKGVDWLRMGLTVSAEARGAHLVVCVAGKRVVEVADATLANGGVGLRVFGNGIGFSQFSIGG